MHQIIQNEVARASTLVAHGRQVQEVIGLNALRSLGRSKQFDALSRCDLVGEGSKHPLHGMLHCWTLKPPKFHLPAVVLLRRLKEMLPEDVNPDVVGPYKTVV